MPSASLAPTAAPTASPSPSPAPLKTPAPTPSSRPSTLPGATADYHLDGSDYASSVLPTGARIRRIGSSVRIDTTTETAQAAWVIWRLPDDQMPAGAVIHGVDVRVCGSGSGYFWEVYGPEGSDPTEYEVTQPEADGCWHFTGAPGPDLTVAAGTEVDSTMTIDAVEYHITFAQ
jgi:hypothetical protein